MLRSFNSLALRQLRTRPLRSVLTAFGVVLGVGMVFGVLLLVGTIRATFDIFRGLTLGGVWRALHRCRAGLRSGVVQHYSPDPDYIKKRDDLYKARGEAAAAPGRVVRVFLDHRGDERPDRPGGLPGRLHRGAGQGYQIL